MESTDEQAADDTGMSLNSTQINLGSTQVSINRGRYKKMPFDISKKNHEIDSILEKIRSLQESGQHIRNDYMLQQTRPQTEIKGAHDIDRPGVIKVEEDQDIKDEDQKTLGEFTANDDGTSKD